MQVTPPDLETPPPPVIIRAEDSSEMPADDYFEAVCAANPDLRIERLSSGEIVIMPPRGFETGYKNNEISRQLGDWARRDGRGLAADSSTEYALPNSARRSPDASWVAKDRLALLSREQKRGFLPLCPDFVIELRSPSDSIRELRTKMCEWIEQGAQLGWLIDPETRTVEIYRPSVAVETLHRPATVQGDGPVTSFVLDLAEVWYEI